jgi:hypothetical protein
MRLRNFLIYRPKKGLTEAELLSVDAEYEKGLASGKKLVLCTLCARSGTRWLGDVFNEHKNATGVTERYFEAESLYRYIKYNKLPIDTSGITKLIKYGIVQDWKKGNVSIVISPFFSHGILELNEVLRPEKIIFGINDPKFTTQSIYNKGFFEQKYVREHTDLALGFQPGFDQEWCWLYLFARLVPNGESYSEWEKLTRIGKIAWWGSMVNRDIWKQMEALPKEKTFVFILKHADQNYEYYKNIAREFGLAPLLSEKKFLAVKGKTVTVKHNKSHEWSSQEQKEFEQYSKEWQVLYEQLSKINPYEKKD